MRLFARFGKDERRELLIHKVGDKRLAVSIRVNTVALHQLFIKSYVLQKERDQRDSFGIRYLLKSVAEHLIITPAIVGRNFHILQVHLGTVVFYQLHHLREVIMQLTHVMALQAIVAT